VDSIRKGEKGGQQQNNKAPEAATRPMAGPKKKEEGEHSARETSKIPVAQE